MLKVIPQLEAEFSHVLTAIIHELDGIAHNFMSSEDMNAIIDNLIVKGGVPSSPSIHLKRWMHIYSKKPDYKIGQIREAIMSKPLVAVVPDCFGLFYDAKAPECQLCEDRAICQKKAVSNGNLHKTEVPEARLANYPVGKKGAADPGTIRDVLEQKAGQISRILAKGRKIILTVDTTNNLRVLTPTLATQSQEDDMSTAKPNTKSKKALVEDDEEEDSPIPAPKKAPKKPVKPVVDEDDEDEGGEEVEDDEEADEEAPKKPAKPAKKVSKAEVEDDDEDEDDEDEDEDDEEAEEEAPKKSKFKPVEKAKKAPKPKPELNKAQQEFAEQCKTSLKDDKKLYKFAKELGVTWEVKEDARINRMRCVMAVKAHLGAVAAPKKSKK